MSLDDWGGKSYRRFTPQIAKYDLPPLKSSNFEQNFRHTTSCFASQRSFLRRTNKTGNIIHHHCEKNMLSKGVMAAGSIIVPNEISRHNVFVLRNAEKIKNMYDFHFFSVTSHFTMKKAYIVLYKISKFIQLPKCSCLSNLSN